MFFVGTKLKIWEWMHKNVFSVLSWSEPLVPNAMNTKGSKLNILGQFVEDEDEAFLLQPLRFVSSKLTCWYKQRRSRVVISHLHLGFVSDL